MARDGWSIKERKAKRMALPGWYVEGEPQLTYGAQLYVDAFWELSTERNFGYVIGPIPWSKIRLFASDVGLDPIMRRVFTHVIREMDEEYQSYQKREQGTRNRARDAATKEQEKEDKWLTSKST